MHQQENMKNNTLLQKAILLAVTSHINQIDDDGSSHFLHVMAVMQITEMVTNDPEVIIAALLHDTIEDAGLTREYLAEHISQRVADLVHEVTHVGNKESGHSFPNLHSRDAAIIKFADRLHNISRMDVWDDKRQQRYLQKSAFWKGGDTNEKKG